MPSGRKKGREGGGRREEGGEGGGREKGEEKESKGGERRRGKGEGKGRKGGERGRKRRTVTNSRYIVGRENFTVKIISWSSPTAKI